MEKVKLGVGIIHNPTGVQPEWTWNLLNLLRYTRNTLKKDHAIDLAPAYIPKARSSVEEACEEILLEFKSSEYNYCWIIQDHLVPPPYSFVHYWTTQCGAAIHGIHFNKFNEVVPRKIGYLEQEHGTLDMVPENFICPRQFLSGLDYNLNRLKSAMVTFDGHQVCDRIAVGGVYYPTSNHVNKFLNPTDQEIGSFNFEGFRFLRQAVNINSLTMPEELMEDQNVVDFVRRGSNLG